MQRKTLISLFSLALLAATMPVPPVQAQNQPDGAQQDQGGGRRGGRGFRGGFGGGFRGATTLGLLRIPEVRQELKVTQDQQELIQILGDELRESAPRLEGGFREATPEQQAEWRTKLEVWTKEQVPKANETLKTILDEGQYKRLQEIVLQRQGANALLDPDVAKSLKLSEEQVAALKKTQEERQAEMFEAFRDARQAGGGGFDREAMREKMESFGKETEAKLLANLTDEQKTKFAAMQGAKFDMPEDAFGFGGAGRGGRGGRGPGGGRPDGDRPQRPQ